MIYGEGEETFSELLKVLILNKDLKNVKGLSYRDKESILINPDRPLINDLNTIPSVYTEDLSKYENKIIYYESSRGCPFSCKFCLSSTIDGFREFTIERVKKDLSIFLKNKIKQVKFIDRTFNANKERTLEILEFINENDNGISNFHFEITAHLLNEEILNFLSEMKNGLVQFEIGVQSTNSKTIENVSRITDFKKLSSVVKQIKSFKNIHIHLDLIAGLPFENYNSFKKSFNDVYRLNPDKLQLGFLKLLKGSELRKEEKEHDIVYYSKAPYEIIKNKYISYEEILKLKDIEELVEVYGSEENFEKTLKYIFNKNGNDYFRFYEDFSLYFREYDYYNRPHSKENRFKILFEYINKIYKEEVEFFIELLRFDFVKNTKSPNIPEFLKISSNKERKNTFFKDKNNRLKYFNEYTEDEYKELHKNAFIDVFNYDIIIEDYEKRNDRIYLFIYSTVEREIKKSKIIDITVK